VTAASVIVRCLAMLDRRGVAWGSIGSRILTMGFIRRLVCNLYWLMGRCNVGCIAERGGLRVTT